MIREVENPSLGDLSLVWRRPDDESGRSLAGWLGDFRFTGSGKGALAIILRFLRATGRLPDKNAEVATADWIGYWVYGQMLPYAFPAKRLSERTRAVLVYHQYGFPQNLDRVLAAARERDLAVIEDCAHALGGTYRGRPLGSFGDFALFSFSKYCFCLALGAVTGRSREFLEYADREIASSSAVQTALKDVVKGLYELSALVDNRAAGAIAGYLVNLSYASYGTALRPSPAAVALLSAKIEREISLRDARFRYFRERTDRLGAGAPLDAEGVVPYVIPVFGSEAEQNLVLEGLRSLGIRSGVYRFDVNRNLFDPRFAPCVWIPCHGGLSDATFEAATAIVEKAFQRPRVRKTA